jgi:hypothetical protein
VANRRREPLSKFSDLTRGQASAIRSRLGLDVADERWPELEWRINVARWIHWSARGANTDRARTREAREGKTRALLGFEKAAHELADSIEDPRVMSSLMGLRGFARRRAFRGLRGETWKAPRAPASLPESRTPGRISLAEVAHLLRHALPILAQLARDEVAALRYWPPPLRGRPSEQSKTDLAQSLKEVWKATGRPLRERGDDREGFTEFVLEVGKTVDPSFRASYAARSAAAREQARRKGTRRKAG